ncbi:MAG: putative toxin-antitoxin system toxin component, PIN family [Thermoproteota archaeon]|uniref:putative toxin-antitoxin system toxin component, PIN family n=1 Tax=Thermofilum sp. TaxID=1961369 RepID=UPI0031659F7F
MRKAVFDTNVLVSAVIQVGKPRLLVDYVLDGKIDLILSKEIVEEFQRVIAREKFKLDKSKQNELTSFILNLGRIVRVRSKLKVVKEDPDDDIVINTAINGKADYIVSGDKHLLALKEFRGIEIIGVDEMLKLLRKQPTKI